MVGQPYAGTSATFRIFTAAAGTSMYGNYPYDDDYYYPPPLPRFNDETVKHDMLVSRYKYRPYRLELANKFKGKLVYFKMDEREVPLVELPARNAQVRQHIQDNIWRAALTVRRRAA